MQDEYYTVRNAINATSIKAGARSMLHMRHAMTGGGREDSPSLRFGRLVHLCALEPAKALETVVVFAGRRAGKEWDKFESDNADKEIVKPDEYEELAAILEAVRTDRHAAKILRGVQAEQNFYWDGKTYGGAKARIDAIGDGYAVEVKTTRAIELEGFERQCWQLGYRLQLGWYAEAMAAKKIPRTAFHVVAIENVRPFDIVTYQVDEDMVEQGRNEAVKIAERYRGCEREGVFAGVSGGEMRVLSLPAWAQEKAAMMPVESMEANEL